MAECIACLALMGTTTPPHAHLVKISEQHSHPIYRCRHCGSELVLLFGCWEPSFPGWLPGRMLSTA